MKSTQKAILALEGFARRAVEASSEHPILIDKFLEDAIEMDVDAVADGEMCVIAGIMEHIEEAGIHSGDSACVTTLSGAEAVVNAIESLKRGMSVKSVQEYHRSIDPSFPSLQQSIATRPTAV